MLNTESEKRRKAEVDALRDRLAARGWGPVPPPTYTEGARGYVMRAGFHVPSCTE